MPLFVDSVPVLAVLCLCILAGEWLAEHTALRHLGTALVVIVLAAVFANVGLIPTSTGEHPLYGILFHEVAWLAIFWLLLEVDFVRILRGGRVLVPWFGLACAATAVACVVSALIFDLPGRLGEDGSALTGMFTGTYTGGSVNFVALATHFDVTDGVLLGAANAVDAALTTVWMAVTLFVPKLLGFRAEETGDDAPTNVRIEGDDRITTTSLSILLVLGLGTVWISDTLPGWLAPILGFEIPGVLVLTTIALVLAQFQWVAKLGGSRLMGIYAVYLFLAVIGALCDVAALRASGELALLILGFAVVLLLLHGLLVFGGTAILRGDAAAASVASQAAVGGGATALVLARSLRRPDLEVPSILVGALGNAVGTSLGIVVVLLL